MVRSGTPEPAGTDQTLGDLVSLATKDVSQLVRYEINLAKSELRSELLRGATAGALFAIGGFFGVLFFFSLCFSYAYLLHWAGAWGGMGGAFFFTAVTVLVLGVALGYVAVKVIRHMTGMKKTRESVTEDLSIFRREDKGDEAAVADGQRPGITGREPR
jgi:ABC-type multidrug transport system fused ATPase/permease subunit